MARPALSDWGIEFFRLTGFTSAKLDQNCTEWWKIVTGRDPESITSRPTIGMFAAEGAIDGMRLQLTVAPGRVDWFLVAQPTEENPIPDLGSFQNSEQRFAAIAKLWFELAPSPIERFAIGLAARVPVENRIAGYKVLVALLPTLAIDTENSADLLYQINRHRPSESVANLRINRLAKWAVVKVNLVSFPMAQQSRIADYCRVELDINTDADSKLDILKRLPALFPELMGHAETIIRDGDVA